MTTYREKRDKLKDVPVSVQLKSKAILPHTGVRTADAPELDTQQLRLVMKKVAGKSTMEKIDDFFGKMATILAVILIAVSVVAAIFYIFIF